MLCMLLLLGSVISSYGFPKCYHTRQLDEAFTYKTRNNWSAKSATSVHALQLPVPYVIIHHSYIPGACTTTEECARAMRFMQTYHQASNGWSDIGYNFAIGGDGAVYEGRGWSNVGAHASNYNPVSIGIVFIGDWVSVVPPTHQLETAKNLIAKGVELGYINQDYKLIGHRQVKNTECPGEALFQEISTWDRFEPNV